ncbi:MS4A5 isoform 2, partial [Pongo abelii]
LSTTTFSTQSPLQKLFATKMKILGTIQILFGIMTFSFGVIFLFTLLKPYPRFPFIFLSGYPFWGSVLFINSGAFLIALKRKTTETLGILITLMTFSIIELFISLPFSILGCHSEDCDCEQCC